MKHHASWFRRHPIIAAASVLLVALLIRLLPGRELWYQQTKRAAVKLLAAARNTNQLAATTGSYGLFLQLTNGGWITIRYRDVHSGGIWSCAVALDSAGGWFESDRHFCGSLSHWPQMKNELTADLEYRELNMDWFSARPLRSELNNGMFPSFREMDAIESAPDLATARRALAKIGFKAFQP